MDDQTAIDVYECSKYCEDHRDHREGDGDTPEEMPIDIYMSPTLTRVVGVTQTVQKMLGHCGDAVEPRVCEFTT